MWHLKYILWLVAVLWKRFCQCKFPAVRAGSSVAVSRVHARTGLDGKKRDTAELLVLYDIFIFLG